MFGTKHLASASAASWCDNCVTSTRYRHTLQGNPICGWGRVMAGGRPPSFYSFTCPTCQALYHIVKVERGPETVDHELACRSCGASLPGREGSFVLKYFMLRKTGADTAESVARLSALSSSR